MARLLTRVGSNPRARVGVVLALWLAAALMGIGAAEWVSVDTP
jgi:hypothetical protein